MDGLADVVGLGEALVLADGALTGGTRLGHDGLADKVGGGAVIGIGLHDDDLRVLGIGLRAGGVGHDVIGQGHAVPDAVDALGVQLDNFGVPVDLNKVGLHAQLFADGSGKLGVKAGEIAVGVSVVHRLIDGVADGHFALVFDVGKVAVGSGFSGGSCGAFRRSCRGCAAAAGGQARGHAECQNGADEFFHDTSSYTSHRSLTLPV